MSENENPPLEEQRQKFNALTKNSKFKVGEPAYIISQKWFGKFKLGVEFPNKKTIDNKKLLKETDENDFENQIELKDNIYENYDFNLLTKEEWDLLYGWHGGGPVIELEVVEDSVHGKAVPIVHKIEVVLKYKDKEKKEKVYNLMSVEDLTSKVRKYFDIPEEEEIRLIDNYFQTNGQLMEKNTQLGKYNLRPGQSVLIDYKEENKWKNSDICSETSSTYFTYNYSSPALGPGKVGLSNLGNTCFFNSGVQCLMHSVPLIKFLLGPDWEKEVNETNPIGMKGKFVRCFQDLAKQIWNPSSSFLTPNELKYLTGERAPQFAGYGQQDSHELMMFMLDGIHEDMNRCKVKSYNEEYTIEGENDDEKAENSWKKYLKINDSIIVDHFQGLIRSTLLCPECENTTVVFDPFMTLTTPIAKPKTTNFTVKFIPWDYKEEIQSVTITLPNHFTEEDASNAMLKELNMKDIHLKFVSKQYAQSNSFDLGIKIYQQSYWVPEYIAFQVLDPKKHYLPIVIKAYQNGYMSSNVSRVFLIEIEKTDEINQSELVDLIYERLDEFFHLSEPQETNYTSVSHFTYTKGFYFSYSLNEHFFRDSFIYKQIVEVFIDPKLPNFDYQAVKHYVDPHSASSYNYNSNVSRHETTLEDCLECFSETETLDEQNQWYCPICKKHVCANKTNQIWKVPECLIIHLKRFSTANSYYVQKDSTNVSYTEEIDMGRFITGPQRNEANKYRLYAVSEHMGGMGGGHYTAHALVVHPTNGGGGEWYSFNDSHASSSDVSSAINSDAYVLFYQKISGS